MVAAWTQIALSDKQRALDLAGPVLVCFVKPFTLGLRISLASQFSNTFVCGQGNDLQAAMTEDQRVSSRHLFHSPPCHLTWPG